MPMPRLSLSQTQRPHCPHALPGVPLMLLVFAPCLQVLLPQVLFGSWDSPGEVLLHPEHLGDGGDNGRGEGHRVQDRCCRLTLSFAGSCSRKRLRQRMRSLPVSGGDCAGSCRVPGRAGTRRMEPGEGAGLCSASQPLTVPQQWQLEASPVLKDIPQLQVRRDRGRRRQKEPEDEVRGQRDLGGQRGGRGVLIPCPPRCRRALFPRNCRGRASGAGCTLATGPPGESLLPRALAAHQSCW